MKFLIGLMCLMAVVTACGVVSFLTEDSSVNFFSGMVFGFIGMVTFTVLTERY